jgi:hypothetical protein
MLLIGVLLLVPLVRAIENLVVFGDSYSGKNSLFVANCAPLALRPVKGKNGKLKGLTERHWLAYSFLHNQHQILATMEFTLTMQIGYKISPSPGMHRYMTLHMAVPLATTT